MIGRLTGTVVEHTPEGGCVIDVGGVGYEVFVPGRSVHALLDAGARATVYVHTHVREDILALYGFASAEDRVTFRVLMGVAGVGPKLALTVLSDLSSHELASAIVRGDKKRLEAISGVGKKLAARLALELKDKLDVPSGVHGGLQPSASSSAEPVVALGDLASQVASALVHLGFNRVQAESAAAKAYQSLGDAPMQDLVRAALGSLR